MQRVPRRKGKLALGPQPDKFGCQTTGDHLISRNNEKTQLEAGDYDEWFPGAKNGLVMYDRGTDDLECYPVATRTTDDTREAFRKWGKT